MDEKLDELIALTKKQNKLMARAADWLTFFGVITVLYIIFQVINFFLMLV